MPWKCPDCKEEVSHLRYTVATTSCEYGTADIIEEKPETEPGMLPATRRRSRMITDHEYSDGGDTDWDGDPSYECPDCCSEINPEDLIWFEEEEKEEDKKEKPIDLTSDEADHAIIKPEKNIVIMKSNKISTDLSMMCKKCKYLFVAERECSFEDFFIDCPKCNETNSRIEYKRLLDEGFFN